MRSWKKNDRNRRLSENETFAGICHVWKQMEWTQERIWISIRQLHSARSQGYYECTRMKAGCMCPCFVMKRPYNHDLYLDDKKHFAIFLWPVILKGFGFIVECFSNIWFICCNSLKYRFYNTDCPVTRILYNTVYLCWAKCWKTLFSYQLGAVHTRQTHLCV